MKSPSQRWQLAETQLASEPVHPPDPDGERLGPLPPGEVVGHYRIVDHIDSGGMGHIHRAIDMRLERFVAIKVAAGRVGADTTRTLKEARALAALNHVNVVTVYELGVHDDRPYIVMELLRGETLRARVDRSPPSLAEALRWACDVLRGMSAAHAAGIVHLDLKPENLFLTADGGLKILDFGVAQLVDPAYGTTGVSAGTVAYMAPEQLARRPVDLRADLFAFGVILHELVTGRHPFKAATYAETAAALVEDRHGPSGDFPDPDVQAVVSACLEHDPSARPERASVVLERLERVLRARSIDVDRTGVEYAETEDGHIAFQSSRRERAPGTSSSGRAGEVDLVVVPGLLSRFEVWTQEPEGANFHRALSRDRRVIVFDRFGLGASDRLSDTALPGMDDEVTHLAAVLDAAKSSRVILLAIAEGAPLALLAAALAPERIAGVVVLGGYAKYSEPSLASELAERAKHWGVARPPDDASSSVRRLEQWIATWERMTASPRTIRAWIAALQRVDVSAILPFVSVPVLVLHDGDDASRPAAVALAEGLANGKRESMSFDGRVPWTGSEAIAARIETFAREVETANVEPAPALAMWCLTDLHAKELPQRLQAKVVSAGPDGAPVRVPDNHTLFRLERAEIAVRTFRSLIARRGSGRAALVVARANAPLEGIVHEARDVLATLPASTVGASPLARAIVEATTGVRLSGSPHPTEPTDGPPSTNTLEDVAPLAHRAFSIEVAPGPRLRIQGQWMLRDPERLLVPHFRRIHELTAGRVGRLVVDVRRLTQINSSNLGVFIQWLGWLSAESADRRYELVIVSNPNIAWQRTNLVPLEMIASDVLRVVTEAP